MLKQKVCWECTQKRNGLGGSKSDVGLNCYPPLSDGEEKEFWNLFESEWKSKEKVWCWGISDWAPDNDDISPYVSINGTIPKYCRHAKKQRRRNNED